jgi:hypothetical protein
MQSVFRKLFGRPATRAARRRRLGLECLEDRAVPAGLHPASLDQTVHLEITSNGKGAAEVTFTFHDQTAQIHTTQVSATPGNLLALSHPATASRTAWQSQLEADTNYVNTLVNNDLAFVQAIKAEGRPTRAEDRALTRALPEALQLLEQTETALHAQETAIDKDRKLPGLAQEQLSASLQNLEGEVHHAEKVVKAMLGSVDTVKPTSLSWGQAVNASSFTFLAGLRSAEAP